MSLAYTPYKKQLKATDDVNKPKALTRAIVGLDDGLENAGNTLAGLMATYKSSVKELDMGLRVLEYKADTIRDTLGFRTMGISSELATPTAWGTIASLSTKLEEFEPEAIV
jgi:hypothetical protein